MRLFKNTFLFAVTMALFLGTASTSTAQEKKNESWSEENATTIEVKDGKVLVNGEVVAELEDADKPVLFKKGEGDGNHMWFSSADGVFGSRSGRTLFLEGDGEKNFSVSTSPRAFGFISKDGERVDFSGEFLHENDIRKDYEMAIGDYMDMSELKNEMETLRLHRGNNQVYAARPFGLYSGGNAETMKQERMAREMAQKIRRADGDTSDMEAELDALLDEIFAAKQDTQQERVDKLREQLTELEERVSQRGSDKNEIIAKRRNELLGKSSKYEW